MRSSAAWKLTTHPAVSTSSLLLPLYGRGASAARESTGVEDGMEHSSCTTEFPLLTLITVTRSLSSRKDDLRQQNYTWRHKNKNIDTCQSPNQLTSTSQISGYVFNFDYQCFRRMDTLHRGWPLEHSQTTISILGGMEHVNTEGRY